MNLSKFPVYVQAAILALVLALVGYLVAQALQFSLKAEVIFAVGLAIGGFIVPLLLKRTPAATAELVSGQETCTLYVGNLPYRANEIAVRELFAEQGQVISVRLMKDKASAEGLVLWRCPLPMQPRQSRHSMTRSISNVPSRYAKPTTSGIRMREKGARSTPDPLAVTN
jgi:RNA recognition motif. (a.k.a. RRM, RBD, or RNP domain)